MKQMLRILGSTQQTMRAMIPDSHNLASTIWEFFRRQMATTGTLPMPENAADYLPSGFSRVVFAAESSGAL